MKFCLDGVYFHIELTMRSGPFNHDDPVLGSWKVFAPLADWNTSVEKNPRLI